MTIDEAIEIKTQWRLQNYPCPLADEINADNLSIEALKMLGRMKEFGIIPKTSHLPGETEE